MRQLMHPDDQKEPQDETFLQGVGHYMMAVFAVSLLWRYDLDVDAKYLLLHVVIFILARGAR